jgi:hypothetical protein
MFFVGCCLLIFAVVIVIALGVLIVVFALSKGLIIAVTLSKVALLSLLVVIGVVEGLVIVIALGVLLSPPPSAYFLLSLPIVRIPTWNLYAVTQHLLARRNFIFLNSPRGFRRSLEERSHNFNLNFFVNPNHLKT